MVGVPGRSKGCHTCRRRRIKCDETKPACHRCTRAGFSCQGYERPRLWRHTSAGTYPERADTDTDTSPPPELSLVGFRPDFYWSALFANFVWRAFGGPWLEQAVAGQLGELPLRAAQALAQSHFGRLHMAADIEQSGMEAYGQCLVQLAADLGQTPVYGGRHLLIPILVVLLQASTQADREGSATHLKGIARLLHLCGPEAFQEEPYLSAYDAARATLTTASLVSRQRLFLEDERWCTVPWARNPAAKSPQSQLLDILIAVPGLLEDRAAWGGDALARAFMLERALRQLVVLFRWRWRWQATTGFSVSIDGQGAADEGHLLLRFPYFDAAIELMLYNVVLMWLLALLASLDPERLPRYVAKSAEEAATHKGTAVSPLALPGATVDVHAAAIETCRAFAWVSRHHSWRTAPVFMYLFPMGVATSVLGATDLDGLAWARRLLAASPVTAGYGDGPGEASVAGFGFYMTPECLHPGVVHAAATLFSVQEMVQLQ